MYILDPEIDIILLRDAVLESRAGILKLWDRRGFAYCYHKFSRGVQVLHIVSTNSGARDQGSQMYYISGPERVPKSTLNKSDTRAFKIKMGGIEKIR